MSESIHIILDELNKSNSSNHKIAVLKKYQDNDQLKQVLKMAYDKVEFTYGMSVAQIDKFEPIELEIPINLDFALASLIQNFCTREVTGHAALQMASNIIGNLPEDDADLIKKIINRDLRINLGKTQINKVFKGLITKPVYMRCDVYSKKTAKNISYPAIVQLKADGTYREITIDSGTISARSRSGEEYDYPVIFEQMKGWPDGVYIGELLVKGITNRAEGNGLINSDNPPHNDIMFETWDYVTLEEYTLAAQKDKKNPCKIPYSERLDTLKTIVEHQADNIHVIDTHVVEHIGAALEKCSEYMSNGLEGAILKDMDGVFKDGTSKHQLKLKLQIDLEVRITGFKPGTPGTKRDGKIGAIEFANDEGTIRGRCSGFSDKQLDEFTAKQDELIGRVITVQFNDLTKAEGNDYWSLSHPRFIELRNDKDTTNTYEEALELKNMAMCLSE